jgi:hypothetical protein
MLSLRDVIGGTFQTVAIQAAERVTMLGQNEIQRVRLLGSDPLRVLQPVEVAYQSYPINPDKVQVLSSMKGCRSGGKALKVRSRAFYRV